MILFYIRAAKGRIYTIRWQPEIHSCAAAAQTANDTGSADVHFKAPEVILPLKISEINLMGNPCFVTGCCGKIVQSGHFILTLVSHLLNVMVMR